MSGKPAAVAREITGRIRLAFLRGPVQEPGQEPDPGPLPVPEIEFVAYADDCILSGRLQLAADRVSDLLNENLEFEFIDVLVEDLAGGTAFEVREIVVQRDDLNIVHATGPRGSPELRRRTRQHPIVAKTGPYEVRGYVHTLPGSDPIASLRRRKPMIALTDAVIEFTVGPVHQQRRASVVILNRDCVDWIAEGSEDYVSELDMPVATAGPLLKDFTGDLLRD